MRHKHILRAGTTGAFWVILCFFGSAQASPAKTKLATPSRAPSGKQQANLDIQPLSPRQMQASKALGLLTTPQITPWQQVTVRPGDTLSGLFSRIGLAASQWRALLALGDNAQALHHLRPGDTLAVRKTPTGRLGELRYPLSPIKTLKVTRAGDHLTAKIQKRATQTREITTTGTVGHSLSQSMTADGVPSGVADRVAQIFHHRLNLKHLRPGDEFAVIYRTTYSAGEKIASGPVVAARLTSQRHVYRAFRAQDSKGDYSYFDSSGQSYKPAFSRKPVAYTHISSPFNPHRLNPVTHTVRPHKGVDMAAPMGTPIHAAAEGTVKYAGWMRGYGRIVELKNFDGYSTRYAHMHKIASGLKVGDHVTKGEVIGHVGQTGMATGPHLHFEIRRSGVAYNPLTVKLPQGHKLPKGRLAKFEKKIHPLVARLSPDPTTLLVRDSSTGTSNHSCSRAVSLNATIALDPVDAAKNHSLGNIFCIVHHHTSSA